MVSNQIISIKVFKKEKSNVYNPLKIRNVLYKKQKKRNVLKIKKKKNVEWENVTNNSDPIRERKKKESRGSVNKI